MRFEKMSFNDGEAVFEQELKSHLDEIEEVLSTVDYQVNYTFQSGRENELIFDPVGTNSVLRDEFTERGWQKEVNIANSGYDTGKDIDITKGPVAGEIQFGNFAYLDADCNRLQRLYEGQIELETGSDIEAGIIIVVKQDMPTSQSVSHYQQATRRAAPSALNNTFTCPNCGEEVDNGIPTLIYGIEPPEEGENVIFNEYEAPRSRTLESQKEISFREKYLPEEQNAIADYDD
ncbi:hypothetical protein E2L06_04135 [Haloterrigena sp. H1]|nr:hypothetical protein E2L06_04135 [Haloterrigena sp. H1]